MYLLHWAASVTLDIDHDPSGPSGYGPRVLVGGEIQTAVGNKKSVENVAQCSFQAVHLNMFQKTSWLLMVIGSCSTEITGQSMLIISNESKYQASAARRKEHTAQWPSTAAATTLLLGCGKMKT